MHMVEADGEKREWEEMRPVRGNKDQTVSMQGLVGHCEAKLGC